MQRAIRIPNTGNGSSSQLHAVKATRDGSAKILGCWKLVSFKAEIQETG
jgi:hypothetical protein